MCLYVVGKQKEVCFGIYMKSKSGDVGEEGGFYISPGGSIPCNFRLLSKLLSRQKSAHRRRQSCRPARAIGGKAHFGEPVNRHSELVTKTIEYTL